LLTQWTAVYLNYPLPRTASMKSLGPKGQPKTSADCLAFLFFNPGRTMT